MIVLGIDPGTASLGWGLIERTGSRLRVVDYGVFSTSADMPLPSRLQAIHAFLEELMESHQPSLLGVERIFHSRNVQTAMAVGHARGVVLLAAAQHHVDVREATPSEVKIAVTGYGSADKEQVARMVQTVLSLPEVPHPDDAADALAVAIWTSHRERAGERINAGVLDRASAAPLRHGESPYERAVREAQAKERTMLEQWDGTPFATGPVRPKAAAPRQPRGAGGSGAGRAG
jgi:crossover junction endodeoxyribonuclease RuvC